MSKGPGFSTRQLHYIVDAFAVFQSAKDIRESWQSVFPGTTTPVRSSISALNFDNPAIKFDIQVNGSRARKVLLERFERVRKQHLEQDIKIIPIATLEGQLLEIQGIANKAREAGDHALLLNAVETAAQLVGGKFSNTSKVDLTLNDTTDEALIESIWQELANSPQCDSFVREARGSGPARDPDQGTDSG